MTSRPRSVLKARGGPCQPGETAATTGCTPARPESRLPAPAARVPPRTPEHMDKDRPPPGPPATPEQVGQLLDLFDEANAAAGDYDRDYLRLADLRNRAGMKHRWTWQQFDAALYAARQQGQLGLRSDDGFTPAKPSDLAAGFTDREGGRYFRVSRQRRNS